MLAVLLFVLHTEAISSDQTLKESLCIQWRTFTVSAALGDTVGCASDW